jgi:hypothetical protein
VGNSLSAGDDIGFRFRKAPQNEVHISRNGRTVTTLRGHAAIDFLSEVESASPADQQQTMARITGNYKRGNERIAAQHPRNQT